MNTNNSKDITLQCLEEPTFVEWVNTEFEAHDEKWSLFIDNHQSDIEAINEAIYVIRELNTGADHNTKIDTEALWQRIKHTTKSKTSDKKLSQRNFSWWSLAAVFILGLIYFFVSMQDNVVISTPHGGQELSHILPDGSKTILFANSKLSYHKKKFIDNRSVKMEGRVFFEVVKGKEFTVLTDRGTVDVLGTSFTIIARERNFQVYCKSGKIRVANLQKNQVLLKQGEGATIDSDDTIHKRSYDFEAYYDAVENGRILFENEKYEIVLREMESLFNIKILAASSIRNKKYTGFIDRNDLKSALKTITWPLKIQYKIVGDQVEIYE